MKTKRQKEAKKRRVVSAARRVKEHTSGFEMTSISLPEGVGLWGPKRPGVYRISIIPYTVAAGNKFFNEGELGFERTFFTHRNIGPEGKSYVCPAKTSGKKCPVCEHRAKLARDPDADEALVKELGPKERQLWNVFDHAEPDKGVQVWEISHFLFGKHLDAKIKNADPDEREDYEQFADPESGKMLRVTASEESMGSNKFLEFGDIEFKERKEELDSEILEAAVCLDECVKELPYNELKKVFLQIEDSGKKGKKKGGEDDDAEDDDDAPEDDGDEDEDGDDRGRKSGKGAEKKARKPADDDDDDDDQGGEDDEGDGDDDQDDEEAVTKGSRVSGKYKGKSRTGVVSKLVKGKNGMLAHVKVKGLDAPWVADVDELTVVPDDDDGDDSDDDPFGDDAEEEEEEDDDDDEPDPRPKKKGKKSSKSDDDDDLPFDLDDDDDEPDPRPKKKGKK